MLLNRLINLFLNQCLCFVSVQNPCTENPCLNDGNCSVIAGGDYSCACPAGYYGKNCETGTFKKHLNTSLDF